MAAQNAERTPQEVERRKAYLRNLRNTKSAVASEHDAAMRKTAEAKGLLVATVQLEAALLPAHVRAALREYDDAFAALLQIEQRYQQLADEDLRVTRGGEVPQ